MYCLSVKKLGVFNINLKRGEGRHYWLYKRKKKVLECSIFTLYWIIVIIKVTIIIERAIKLAWFERKLGIEVRYWKELWIMHTAWTSGTQEKHRHNYNTCIIIWSRLWLMTCLDTALNIDIFKYKWNKSEIGFRYGFNEYLVNDG